MTTMEEHIRAAREAAMQEHEATEKRRKIVRSVAHSSAMEGLPLDAETLRLLDQYADGTMTTEQLREIVLAQYRR
ncbi:antitoxin VbhA family protein [Deinococcus hopiensis]|uniref:Antitoxin VbhA domain-containing protein n=1 Tax=Deinococcus hopiensis KR-140 TaxID=695939 RepID=A0A1W1UZE7_9DEIO|nr:antitoxin VbhA family protein [Deinococcus hopiensis]SMB86449.1 hypothetical protein SAMN00790413_03817 [Deinococcus hopiensis KR-140]